MDNIKILSKKMENLDTWNEDKAICPYCKYEHDDCYGWNLEEGESEEWECGNCDESFTVLKEVKVTYSTEKLSKK